ncbi:MAG: hypothetical protein HRF43_20355, partial [Phycisphaerae bacterium]
MRFSFIRMMFLVPLLALTLGQSCPFLPFFGGPPSSGGLEGDPEPIPDEPLPDGLTGGTSASLSADKPFVVSNGSANSVANLTLTLSDETSPVGLLWEIASVKDKSGNVLAGSFGTLPALPGTLTNQYTAPAALDRTIDVRIVVKNGAVELAGIVITVLPTEGTLAVLVTTNLTTIVQSPTVPNPNLTINTHTATLTARITGGALFDSPTFYNVVWTDSNGNPADDPVAQPVTVLAGGGFSTTVQIQADAVPLGPQTYTATITDRNGNQVSGAVTVTVVPAPGLSISVNPDPPDDGQLLTMTANISGGIAPYTFQWSNLLADGVPNDNFTFSNGIDNAQQVSAVVPAGTQSVAVTVDVTDSGGNSIRLTRTISELCAPPTFTAEPTDQTVVCGGTATFTATAAVVSGNPGALALKWQYDLGGGNFTDIANGIDALPGGTDVSGATSGTLTLTGVVPATPTRYRCVATDNCGSTASQIRNLDISAFTIATQPTAQTVCEGDTATFTVAVAGTGPGGVT